MNNEEDFIFSDKEIYSEYDNDFILLSGALYVTGQHIINITGGFTSTYSWNSPLGYNYPNYQIITGDYYDKLKDVDLDLLKEMLEEYKKNKKI